MPTQSTSPAIKTPVSFLLALTSKLTIGSAVCFTEGLAASILTIVPRNHWFYIVSTGLALAIWVAFWRFRDSKLGADIGDLSFIEFVLRTIAMALFFLNIDSSGFWYAETSLSALKIIRVYLWQSSLTQQLGWGTFGPLTFHYSKRYGTIDGTARPVFPLAGEIGIALFVAVGVSVAIKQLGDFERVVAVWVVPLTFEFLYGPIQLRSLAAIRKDALAGEKREAETAAENDRLKHEIAKATAALEAAQREIEMFRTMQNAPSAEHIALLEAYEATKPERKSQLVKIAQNVAKAFAVTGEFKQ